MDFDIMREHQGNADSASSSSSSEESQVQYFPASFSRSNSTLQLNGEEYKIISTVAVSRSTVVVRRATPTSASGNAQALCCLGLYKESKAIEFFRLAYPTSVARSLTVNSSSEQNQLFVEIFIPGRELYFVLKEVRLPSLQLNYIRLALQALNELHQHKIVHLDPHTSNVKVDQNLHAVYCDFGFSNMEGHQGRNPYRCSPDLVELLRSQSNFYGRLAILKNKKRDSDAKVIPEIYDQEIITYRFYYDVYYFAAQLLLNNGVIIELPESLKIFCEKIVNYQRSDEIPSVVDFIEAVENIIKIEREKEIKIYAVCIVENDALSESLLQNDQWREFIWNQCNSEYMQNIEELCLAGEEFAYRISEYLILKIDPPLLQLITILSRFIFLDTRLLEKLTDINCQNKEDVNALVELTVLLDEYGVLTKNIARLLCELNFKSIKKVLAEIKKLGNKISDFFELIMILNVFFDFVKLSYIQDIIPIAQDDVYLKFITLLYHKDQDRKIPAKLYLKLYQHQFAPTIGFFNRFQLIDEFVHFLISYNQFLQEHSNPNLLLYLDKPFYLLYSLVKLNYNKEKFENPLSEAMAVFLCLNHVKKLSPERLEICALLCEDTSVNKLTEFMSEHPHYFIRAKEKLNFLLSCFPEKVEEQHQECWRNRRDCLQELKRCLEYQEETSSVTRLTHPLSQHK